MNLLVFGSLNTDHTYHMDQFIRPGETRACGAYEVHAGGKGLNQAVALAKAGCPVSMAGAVGSDGQMLLDYLTAVGIDISHVYCSEEPTGHAVIQINREGENAIIIHGGANRSIPGDRIEKTISAFCEGDWLLLQNEINDVDQIIRRAHRQGMTIVLNPSPATKEMKDWPLELVDWFVLNEIEGEDLTGLADPEEMLPELVRRYPAGKFVLTLGEKGAVYADARTQIRQPAIPAHLVDTTAAGDTFVGYLIAELTRNVQIRQALLTAAAAASITISRKGAGESIPRIEEVTKLLKTEAMDDQKGEK